MEWMVSLVDQVVSLVAPAVSLVAPVVSLVAPAVLAALVVTSPVVLLSLMLTILTEIDDAHAGNCLRLERFVCSIF